MELDLNWILLGLPLAFALGWLASRVDLRQLRLENTNAPKAYFRGLGHLLNEQQDEAIDAFIEAIQKDPDTSELHFALGNLFRRRGEYERAVRVHEHLVSRADLSNADRERAQHALALDFLAAGLLDHAEAALLKLQGTPYESDARLALLALYERAHDWDRATDMARQLQAGGQADFSARVAHHLCEQAAQLQREGNDAGDGACAEPVRALLEQAVQEAPDAVRAGIELARLLARTGQAPGAHDAFAAVVARAPAFAPLVATEMVQQATHCARVPQTAGLLEDIYAKAPSVDLADALARADLAAGRPAATARQRYVRHMRQEPSIIAADHWLAQGRLSDAGDGEAHALLSRSVAGAALPQSRYRCAACGFEASDHFWQCPGCQSWDSFPPRRIEEL
ncbi:MAG: lipopolysaccharide assembly protein LapB [Ottowia sp.]|nr:lipopolysaccharide assembly protein LapB [Ottowia sp.]